MCPDCAKCTKTVDEVFAEMDTDKSGFISPKELIHHMMSQKCHEEKCEKEIAMMKLFEECDINKDGKLCKEEFAVFMAKMKEMCPDCAKCTKTLDEVFAEMDSNKDGFLTSCEIKAHMMKQKCHE
jgi:Ca2+-binding EF-hand superfamily protein